MDDDSYTVARDSLEAAISVANLRPDLEPFDESTIFDARSFLELAQQRGVVAPVVGIDPDDPITIDFFFARSHKPNEAPEPPVLFALYNGGRLEMTVDHLAPPVAVDSIGDAVEALSKEDYPQP